VEAHPDRELGMFLDGGDLADLQAGAEFQDAALGFESPHQLGDAAMLRAIVVGVAGVEGQEDDGQSGLPRDSNELA
jgi:hypothetical protein